MLYFNFNVYNLTSIVVQLLPLKGKRKASLLEQKITIQDEAAVKQCALLHKFKKEVRQHTVDKQDAVEDATKTRDDLAFVQKKNATRIKSLEREVLNKVKVKDNMDMKTVVEGQLCSMEASERDLATRRRILAVEQDDLQKQQAASASQVSSLAFQRERNKTARKKMKTSHSKNLQLEQETREREKQVKICPEASFFSCARIVSFLLLHDSLIVLLFKVLQGRIAKLKDAEQLANHAARLARRDLQRHFDGQHNKEEETVEVDSDSDEKTVRLWCILGTKFILCLSH